MSTLANVPQNCKMAFTQRRITVSREFYKRASAGREPEYSELVALMNSFPDFDVVEKAPRRSSKKAQLPYSKMIQHICRQKDAEKGLKDFNAIRYPAGEEPSTYGYVKKWFYARYPNYGKPPAFDKTGKLITNMAAQEQKNANDKAA